MKMDLNDHLLVLEVELAEEDIIKHLNLTYKPNKSIKYLIKVKSCASSGFESFFKLNYK